MIKSFKYFLQSILIYIFFIFGRLLGLNVSRKIYSFIFTLLGPKFKSKKVIEKNLKIFSPNIQLVEKKLIISNMWNNYGKTFIEYIFLDRFKNGNAHIRFEGGEVLDSVIKKNRPVIFVSGHFANFELMSMEISKKNMKLATIYRPLNNYFLNPFMEYLRKKYVCENQIKKGINGVRDAINFIKKDFSIALMIDQRVSEGEKINFFSEPALTTTLPAQLALKYDLSIIPVFIERKGSIFKLKFYNEIFPSNFSNKIMLTKKLNEILEQMIRKNPNEWIWTHDRWK